MTNIPDLSTLRPKVNRRIADDLAAWVSAATAGPDLIGWDTALTLIPTQAGPQPGYLVVLRLPSPVLGEFLVHVVVVDLGSLTQAAITAQVRDAVERLRVQRSELLTSTNGGRG